MPIFKLESKGKKYEVNANSPDEAVSKVRGFESKSAQPSFQAPASPQGLQQTPTVAGTGKLNNRAINALETAVDVGTPLGSMHGLVGQATGDQPAGPLTTALRLADVGLGALPGYGLAKAVAKTAMSPFAKASLVSSAGAALGGATADLADVQNPLGRAALMAGGGLGGQKILTGISNVFGPKNIQEAASLAKGPKQSQYFGALSPAQEQVSSGKLMSPEIEREALNRSSAPIQELAQRQGRQLEDVLTGKLKGVAPIQDPMQAAASFQGKFEAAKETAGGLMDELNKVVKAESKGVNHNVIGVELRDAWINRLRREGWKVDKEGKIIKDLTSPGYSKQAADTIQEFLDAAPGVKNLQTITDFKRNFGTAIEKAFQEGGNYASGVQKRLYGATKAAAKSVTPDFAQGTVDKGNKAWNTVSKVEDLGNMEKSLGKDPSKFYDSLLTNAANDKNFTANLQKNLTKAGMDFKDIQSVAVSNVGEKLKKALNNPARDEVDRVVSGLSALEKELGRVPISARKQLFGEALPEIEKALKEGAGYKEWAYRLRNSSETARNAGLQKVNRIANVLESVASGIPFIGRQSADLVGKGVRKLGAMSDERAMKQYLEGGVQTAKPAVSKSQKFGQYGPLLLRLAAQGN